MRRIVHRPSPIIRISTLFSLLFALLLLISTMEHYVTLFFRWTFFHQWLSTQFSSMFPFQLSIDHIWNYLSLVKSDRVHYIFLSFLLLSRSSCVIFVDLYATQTRKWLIFLLLIFFDFLNSYIWLLILQPLKSFQSLRFKIFQFLAWFTEQTHHFFLELVVNVE